MEETRVSKYKEYRSKLIREGAPMMNLDQINGKDSSLSDTLNTLTLPIDEVYETISKQDEEQEDLVKLERKKFIFKYTFLGIFLFLLTVAIVLFAIFAFKK